MKLIKLLKSIIENRRTLKVLGFSKKDFIKVR